MHQLYTLIYSFDGSPLSITHHYSGDL